MHVIRMQYYDDLAYVGRTGERSNCVVDDWLPGDLPPLFRDVPTGAQAAPGGNYDGGSGHVAGS
jgi:hypothetical protein